MAVDSTYIVVAAGGGLMMGSFAGRGPQAIARELGRPGTGVAAMAVCMAVGFLCGGIFGFPVSGFLSGWIGGMGPADTSGGGAGDYAGPNTEKVKRAFRNAPTGPTNVPYTVIGPVIVCN